MSFLPPVAEGTKKDRELIPAKLHEAYLFGIVDLGTQERKPYMGVPKEPCRHIMLFFEFVDERRSFKDGADPEPMIKSQKYAYFTDEKSSLAKLCKAWLSKSVQDVAFGSLAGTPAQITIAHQKSDTDGKVYDNMTAISELSPKLVPLMTPQFNENMYFSITQDGFDSEKFGKLYPWVQKVIKESAEYEAYTDKIEPAEDTPFDDSQIPF